MNRVFVSYSRENKDIRVRTVSQLCLGIAVLQAACASIDRRYSALTMGAKEYLVNQLLKVVYIRCDGTCAPG